MTIILRWVKKYLIKAQKLEGILLLLLKLIRHCGLLQKIQQPTSICSTNEDWNNEQTFSSLNSFFKQQHISPLLRDIEAYGTSLYVTAQGEKDEHPSDIERALYRAGFLADHGVDVNKALQEWETEGICVDAEILYQAKPGEISSGTLDFISAYEKWKESHKQETYEKWKDEEAKRWLSPESGPAYVEKERLIEHTKNMLTELTEKPYSYYYKSEALFSYNFLRELDKQPPAASISEIDKEWLNRIETQSKATMMKTTASPLKCLLGFAQEACLRVIKGIESVISK